MDPAWIALIGTVTGGVGLKLVEHWLGRNRVKTDDAARIRDELRQEITAQRAEIKQLELDVDKWRMEYYELKEKYMTLQTELMLAVHNIKESAVSAEKTAKDIDSQPPNTS